MYIGFAILEKNYYVSAIGLQLLIFEYHEGLNVFSQFF